MFYLVEAFMGSFFMEGLRKSASDAETDFHKQREKAFRGVCSAFCGDLGSLQKPGNFSVYDFLFRRKSIVT